MTILLVRHGATELNIARILQPPDTPLSALGLAQAQAVARRLALLRPAAVISSDLPRAFVTAETIAQRCGLTVQTTELLHERDFGDLRGQPYDGLGFDPLTMAHAPAGGESAGTFVLRVARAFALLVERRAALTGPLVVVTHGLVIRAMLAGPASLASDRLGIAPIGNTAVTIVAAQAPHGVELLNSTSHLDGEFRSDPRALFGG